MKDEFNDRFGALVKKRRIAMDMTQDDLGFLCRLSRPSISLIELGKQSPTLVQGIIIARALKINLKTLSISGEDIDDSKS